MAGMINQLIAIMNEQSERYGELLGLSHEKRDVIIKNDVDTLQKITHLENILVSQNQKLERKRLEVIKDIAAVLGKKESELTLDALINIMEGQKEQTALIDVGNRIRDTLNKLSEVNARNASLIENALDYIEYSLNVIRSTITQNGAMYTANGETLTDDMNLFDAKH